MYTHRRRLIFGSSIHGTLTSLQNTQVRLLQSYLIHPKPFLHHPEVIPGLLKKRESVKPQVSIDLAQCDEFRVLVIVFGPNLFPSLVKNVAVDLGSKL